MTRELVESIVADEHAALARGRLVRRPPRHRAELFVETALDDEFVDFLTLPAYAAVLDAGG